MSIAGDLLVSCSTYAVLWQQNSCRREWYVCVGQLVFCTSSIHLGKFDYSCIVVVHVCSVYVCDDQRPELPRHTAAGEILRVPPVRRPRRSRRGVQFLLLHRNSGRRRLRLLHSIQSPLPTKLPRCSRMVPWFCLGSVRRTKAAGWEITGRGRF